jgi:peptidyl-prolyl cis-trans isomerase B (cyclophilin B)
MHTGGDNIYLLENELAAQTKHHDAAGIVSLLVSEPKDSRPVKERLIASQGKLITILQQVSGLVAVYSLLAIGQSP